MEWQHPQWLYLILPLVVAWAALSFYSRRRRLRAAEAFVAQAMWSRILPPDSRVRFWTKLFLREAAIVLGLIALAEPQFGTQYEDVIPRGADLYVLIDVSRSMLAEDVPPSRLKRAKADVAALVNRLEGERVGLIAFAGQAVVKCPLTVDYDSFRRSLDELDPGSAPRGGTAIGDAIRKALEVFQAQAERDQAILLITDGDDQQSYPLDAAAIAAERHVTIFTVGLGDADHGARIPQGAESKSFVEYKGQQVWSKLDGSLLKEIALKTSGVYVPVGTRAYDLGELYAKYLQGRRGGDEASHKRIRRAEQYQIFLALALLALLIDIFTRPHPAAARAQELTGDRAVPAARNKASRTSVPRPAIPVATALLLVACLCGTGRADSAAANVRDGLNWYNKGDFDKAREKFAAAREQLDSRDAAKAAIAAFDQACALHRKGDIPAAREWYLKAGLAHDKTLAASAHFNLGTLSAQEAARLAGEKPEDVAPDKRPEILDQLKAAVASFRHCLDLQPEHVQARRDIELVRRWIKYYSDRWVARDREKRRQEMNLVAFLEFLIETQKVLRESVKALPEEASSDAFADPKQVQDELQEEIQPLKDKIKAELTPPPQAPAGGSSSSGNRIQQGVPPEVEQGITMLQGWAGAAGDKMASASHHLDERRGAPAATDQQAAIDELEKIWDAVIPFHALLARDLADQTGIARALAPEPADETTKPPGAASPSSGKAAEPGGARPATQESSKKTEQAASVKTAPPSQTEKSQEPRVTQPEPQDPSAAAAGSRSILASERQDLGPLTETEERTQRRTQLLKLKAEAELDRLAKSPPTEAEVKPKTKSNAAEKDQSKDGDADQPQPIDPKLIKAGFQKAVELAPRAVEQMGRAVKSLKQKSPDTAFPPAEEARKILEEIQKAQPKDPKKEQEKKEQQKKDQEKKDQQDQEKKDQEKKDQQDQEKKDQEKKDQDQEKKDQQKKDQDKQDQEKKDQEQKKKQDDQSQSGEQKKDRKGEQPQVSQDQIEDALRKVRERQQEKRERDRRMKARILGRVPVEKDW